jgi:DNA-directed RNA polymerase
MDATNSGMQHLCAMTRAEEGAYVNLVPSAAGDDLYKRVGDNLGLDRDLVKRPVMTYFYGSRTGGWSKSKRDGKWRSFGVTKQVADVLRERGQSIKGVRGKAVEILDNIRGMIPRAAAVRDFLETLARICSDNGKHLHWTSALGLPVVNCYNELNIKPLSVTLNGRRRRVNFAVGYKKEIKKTRAVNGATANFIHSCDACHLQMVALEAAKENIPVIPVHDCYGTLAPRALRLLDIVRQQFAQLHTRHNLLNEVRESVRRDIPKAQLPPLPEIGTLDPEGILAVNSPSILRRLKNTILTEAKNSKPPIDIEATADRDAVAQAVREANHGDIPDPPIKLGQLSDAEFREYTRKNFGF